MQIPRKPPSAPDLLSLEKGGMDPALINSYDREKKTKKKKAQAKAFGRPHARM